jgi:putative oxidoreductase
MNEQLTRLRPLSHNLLRIMVGLMYWTHGADKLFAWFGREEPVDLLTRFGAAGVIETFGGALIVLGLFTQPVAFLISGEMAVAYFWMHVSNGGLWWWANRGELPAVYSFVFLYLAAVGAGSFSLDAWLARRRAGQG